MPEKHEAALAVTTIALMLPMALPPVASAMPASDRPSVSPDTMTLLYGPAENTARPAVDPEQFAAVYGPAEDMEGNKVDPDQFADVYGPAEPENDEFTTVYGPAEPENENTGKEDGEDKTSLVPDLLTIGVMGGIILGAAGVGAAAGVIAGHRRKEKMAEEASALYGPAEMLTPPDEPKQD